MTTEQKLISNKKRAMAALDTYYSIMIESDLASDNYLNHNYGGLASITTALFNKAIDDSMTDGLTPYERDRFTQFED